MWYYSFAQPRQNAPHRLSKKFLHHWTGQPRDCRQALTCRLPNQNQTMAQRASPSMGPSKPDKEAPGLQPTGKWLRSNSLTQTDDPTIYTTLISSQVKLSFVGTYNGTKRRTSQDHGTT